MRPAMWWLVVVWQRTQVKSWPPDSLEPMWTSRFLAGLARDEFQVAVLHGVSAAAEEVTRATVLAGGDDPRFAPPWTIRARSRSSCCWERQRPSACPGSPGLPRTWRDTPHRTGTSCRFLFFHGRPDSPPFPGTRSRNSCPSIHNRRDMKCNEPRCWRC